MCGRVTVSTAMLLFILHAAIAQTVSQAYAVDDGKAHVVYAGGVTKVVPPEQQQVGCESVSVAPDQRTIGWSVLVDNCCTSYPIPIAIVVYRDGRKTVISPGQIIYEWHFVGRGDRISVLFGPVHGYASPASVYDARSGRVQRHGMGKALFLNGQKVGRNKSSISLNTHISVVSACVYAVNEYAVERRPN